MISKTIKYHDFDGDEREDTFYFSLNETQFAKLNGMFPGGLEAYTAKVTKDKNADEMYHIIDTIVTSAYGERSGSNFVKKAPNGQPLSDFFVNTEAYDNLMTELLSGENNLINFLMGCLNKDAHDRAQAEFNKRKAELDANKAKLEVVKPEN